jgi:hypothetical protein
LRRQEALDMARALLPEWRVASCQRFTTGGLVSVIHHPEHGSASYGGLAVCGSVWVCPVCAARIGARRAEDVTQAAEHWTAQGGQIVMLTLTLRHHAGRQLAELLAALNAAYRKMRQGKAWAQLAASLKLAGTITAREITHGANGWHPHLHALFFLRAPLGPEAVAELGRQLAARWTAALGKLGESATIEHGCDLRVADAKAGSYVAKLNAGWSAAYEVAGAGAKEGRQGSRTAAQLLDAAGRGEREAGALFVEYAMATYGRNWLVWTPGLRALCGLDGPEANDVELAAQEEAGGVVIIALTSPQWRWVVGNSLRGHLLAQACQGDGARLAAWLALQGLEIEEWQLNYGRAA